MHVDSTRYHLIAPRDLPDYRARSEEITAAAWPDFMFYDPVAVENWHELFSRFADYQFALVDRETQRLAAIAHSLPFRWDQPLEALPDGGWDWVFIQALKDHDRGIAPNSLSALSITIHPDYQNQKLSSRMVRTMRAIAVAKGFKNLVVPVRPNRKSRYPLTSIDDYITWKTEEGLPLDPWLRVHVRLGARIIKPCHRAMIICGTRAQWEERTGLDFPQNGPYVIPGALCPMEMDLDRDEGVYIEPNVWMVHPLA